MSADGKTLARMGNLACQSDFLMGLGRGKILRRTLSFLNSFKIFFLATAFFKYAPTKRYSFLESLDKIWCSKLRQYRPTPAFSFKIREISIIIFISSLPDKPPPSFSPSYPT